MVELQSILLDNTLCGCIMMLNLFDYFYCCTNMRLFFRYGHMIDNVVLIVTGTLHERDVQELLEKCHPLGMFDR